ncbi:MAG: monooxygenase, partial [Myxococcales bacterium]|nr:monooxygenase [Myxococcales bacterium]
TAYTPAPPNGDVNDLRCFVLDPELGDDAMLVGFDVTPGERRVVHHVLLYSADSDELAALDAADPGPGYGCPGGPGASSARVIAGWVPGMPANHYPESTGVPLAKDERLVMQIHYNTAQAGPLPDRSAVDLMLAEAAVDAPAQIFSIADHDFAIPPQTHGHTTTVEVDVPAAGTLWAAAPHMHLLGRQARVEVERANGDVACLVDIPSWSFDWQQFYFLADPAGLAVAPGDTIRFSCTWDNDTPEAVTWGDGTEDEMCITYLYATAK